MESCGCFTWRIRGSRCNWIDSGVLMYYPLLFPLASFPSCILMRCSFRQFVFRRRVLFENGSPSSAFAFCVRTPIYMLWSRFVVTQILDRTIFGQTPRETLRFGNAKVAILCTLRYFSYQKGYCFSSPLIFFNVTLSLVPLATHKIPCHWRYCAVPNIVIWEWMICMMTLILKSIIIIKFIEFGLGADAL